MQVFISRRNRSCIYRLPGVGGPIKVTIFDLKDRKVRVPAAKLVTGDGVAKEDMRKENLSRKQIDKAR